MNATEPTPPVFVSATVQREGETIRMQLTAQRSDGARFSFAQALALPEAWRDSQLLLDLVQRAKSEGEPLIALTLMHEGEPVEAYGQTLFAAELVNALEITIARMQAGTAAPGQRVDVDPDGVVRRSAEHVTEASEDTEG